MADDIQQMLGRLGPHTADVDIHHRQGRLDDLRKGVVVKGHHAHIRRNADLPVLQSIHAAQGDIVIGADDGIGVGPLLQEIAGHTVAVGPGGFSQPDVLIRQVAAAVFQALLYPLQAVGRAQVIVETADKGDPPVALREQEGGRHSTGIGVVIIVIVLGVLLIKKSKKEIKNG